MKPNHFQLSKRDLKKGVKLPPQMSEELAEIVGIHFGDGNMQNKYNHTHRLLYSFNIRDRKYAEYVKALFHKLFNIRLKFSEEKRKGSITLYFYSKSLCNFFNTFLKIPYSPKENLSIPLYIRENERYTIGFFRGLFDTDGCVTKQKTGKYEYGMIKICTKIKNFAEEIKHSLADLGFYPYISRKKCGYDVIIKRKGSVDKFMSLAKPRNKKGNEWGCWDSNS